MMIIAGIVALLCFTYSAEGNVFFSKIISLRGVFIIRKSKDRQKKGQTTIYKTYT